MHNLKTVFQFEVMRSLKKKTFWAMALSFPVLIGVVVAIIFFSNKTTQQAAEEAKNQNFSIALTDRSGRIDQALIQNIKASEVADKQQGIDMARQGKIDAYFYYPQDLTKNAVEVYGKDVGLFENSRYEGVAKSLLEESVGQNVDPTIRAVLQKGVAFEATTYKNGAEYNGFKEVIAPGIFLVLFYVLIAMFGNQMLTSTTEEKENRVIEMILTTIEARTLVIGKILSLITLALIQILVILIPVIIAYVLLREHLSLPSFDITSIPLDWTRIAVGAILFTLSFLLFTGILVGVGAVAPTAKEAASFFGGAMVLLFGPLYAVTLFVSVPDSPIVRILSFFPLTAPVPLLLRNAVGNLTPLETLLGITILAISAALALAASVRLFRYGALEYSKRLSLRLVLYKPKKL